VFDNLRALITAAFILTVFAHKTRRVYFNIAYFTIITVPTHKLIKEIKGEFWHFSFLWTISRLYSSNLHIEEELSG